MQISDILSKDKTFNNIISNSKKRALEQSAHLLSQSLHYKILDEDDTSSDSLDKKPEKKTEKKASEAPSKDTAPKNENVDEFDIFNALIEREQLGSTTIGHGVAIPHCALENIENASAVMLRLNKPVDFDATDNTPIDLIIALAVPNDQCEKFKSLLTTLATLLQDPRTLEKLRNTENSESLYTTLLSCEHLLLLNTHKSTLSA